MTYTYIEFPEDLLEHVESVCSTTVEQDETFRYRIVPSKFKQYHYVLVMYSKDKDQAHKRGMWFVKKIFAGKELLYWVKEHG
jgi:hypothetical protein